MQTIGQLAKKSGVRLETIRYYEREGLIPAGGPVCRAPTFSWLLAAGQPINVECLHPTMDARSADPAMGPEHGYGITKAIRANSGEALRVETGSLYPGLHRPEKQGWLKSQWKLTESNQRAKYYRLTPAGNKQLASEHTRWN